MKPEANQPLPSFAERALRLLRLPRPFMESIRLIAAITQSVSTYNTMLTKLAARYATATDCYCANDGASDA